MKTPALPTRPSARAGSAAFTLMELMIVIVIIGILISIAVPGTKIVIDRANKISAQNDALNLKNAITAYQTDYRKLPTKEKGADSGSSPVLSDGTLMDVLLGADSEASKGGLNPRRIAFFKGGKARPAGNGKFRKGVSFENDGGGELWDPWTEHYRVVMDTDYDGRIPVPSFETEAQFLNESVIVWSAGKDMLDDESKDNVVTW